MVAFTASQAQQKVNFKPLEPLPHSAFFFGAANSPNEIYLIGGTQGFQKFSRIFQAYDTKRNTYLSGDLVDFSGVMSPAAIYLEEYNGVLIAGGTRLSGTNELLLDTIRMLDLENYKLSAVATLPKSAKTMGVANMGNKVYFFGGSTQKSRFHAKNYTFTDNFFVYDLTLGTVEELPKLPKSMETKGGIFDGKLYVFGGYDGRSLSEVWQYDIENEQWKALASLKQAMSAYALVQYQHYFILIGDYYDGDRLVVYNTKNKSAQYYEINISARHMGAAVINDQLHVYGGLLIDGSSAITGANFGHYVLSISELIKN